MDQIEFVTSPRRLPIGLSERVEPIINGVSLAEAVALVEGRGYVP